MSFEFGGFETESFGDFETELEDFEVVKVKKFDRLWKYGEGGSVCQSTYKDGTVYFGACDSYVYAVDAKDGKLKWKYRTSGMIMAHPHVSSKNVFIGSYDNYMYAFDRETGKLLWKFKTGGKLFSTPDTHDNFVYFGSEDGFAYCIDVEAGKEVWRFKSGEDIASSALFFEDKVFIGSYDGNMYCLDAKTGKEIWRFKTGDQVQVTDTPHIKNRMLFFGSFDNNTYAVNIDTGKEVWRYRTGKYGLTAPPFVYGDSVYVPDRDGFIYSLDMNGKERWRFKTGGMIAKVRAIEDKVFFGSEDEYVYCLTSEGKELWRYKTSGAIYDMEVDEKGEKIFFGSWDCHEYSVDVKTGKELWRFRTSSLVQGYMPPSTEAFKLEVKKATHVDDAISEEKYKSKKEESVSLSNYNVTSEYSTTSEYRQKSDYDVNFVMFEDVMEVEELWSLVSKELDRLNLRQR